MKWWNDEWIGKFWVFDFYETFIEQKVQVKRTGSWSSKSPPQDLRQHNHRQRRNMAEYHQISLWEAHRRRWKVSRPESKVFDSKLRFQDQNPMDSKLRFQDQNPMDSKLIWLWRNYSMRSTSEEMEGFFFSGIMLLRRYSKLKRSPGVI